MRIPFDSISGRHVSHQITVPAEIGATSAAEVEALPADSPADACRRDNSRRLTNRTASIAYLHDRVIQRAFGIALHLSSVLDDAATDSGDRLKEMVTELDQIIADIRTTIFDTQSRSR